MKKRIIALLTSIALLIALICISPGSEAGVETLNLTKQSKIITVGKSFQAKIDGITASKVKWSSSNKGVATARTEQSSVLRPTGLGL